MNGPDDALSELQRRLNARRERDRLSWADFARSVHVAPQTLMDLLRAKPGEYRDAGVKKAAGRAETVGRIVRFVNRDDDHPINLIAVLSALGLESVGLGPTSAPDRLLPMRTQDEDIR